MKISSTNSSAVTPEDARWLRYAGRVGARHQGASWPNPSVGCVLVAGGQVIAAAVTAIGGRPHAETQALDLAGPRARGATAYVTLEPCAHHGRTPPCAEALIAAGIRRVVFGASDPDPRVAGAGEAKLREAGIAVLLHHDQAATRSLRGYLRRVRHGLPAVSLKLATSADGWMLDPSGAPRWLTGELARAHGRALRAQHDAIVTGIGTVLADDPALTPRLPGVAGSTPVRVVLDRSLRLPLRSQLVQSAARTPSWVCCTTDALSRQAPHSASLREAGVVIHAAPPEQWAQPLTLLRFLAAQGFSDVMLEAGPTLSAAWLNARVVDRLAWYRAPGTIGDGQPPAHPALHQALNAAIADYPGARASLAPDTLTQYELAGCLPD